MSAAAESAQPQIPAPTEGGMRFADETQCDRLPIKYLLPLLVLSCIWETKE